MKNQGISEDWIFNQNLALLTKSVSLTDFIPSIGLTVIIIIINIFLSMSIFNKKQLWGNSLKKLYENIYVSGHEEEIIKSLTEDGTVLYIQMVPDNEVVYIRDLI